MIKKDPEFNEVLASILCLMTSSICSDDINDNHETEIYQNDADKIMNPYDIDFYSEKDVPKYKHNKLRKIQELLK
jgi:hypothetical protein